MAQAGRMLIVVGLLVAAAGLAMIFADRIPWLGRLPGDILIRRKNFTVFIPLATMLLVSLVLTVIANLIFRR